ncbi:MAG: NAD-dependent epimerase/dehydratase family protein, partial [Bacteroidetes bacterium]|nr:NAD-dependent epimerase/dehydratase family protein [Bacteroidota bacterium]
MGIFTPGIIKMGNNNKIKKNIVCTGGCGFIGSNIVDKLVNLGHNVIVIDNLSTGKIEYLNPKAKFIQEDIRSSKILQTIRGLDQIDAIIHTAAKGRVQPSLKSPIDYHNNNVTGTLNLLEACRLSNIPKFIYSSSSSVYGNTLAMSEDALPKPTSPYALTKYLGELYCKMHSDLYGTKTICLRYFNVYGNRGCDDLVLGIFTKQKLEGKPLTITNDGLHRRDFTFVGDVVDANIRALRIELNNNHEIINIGNSDNRSIIEVAKLFDHPINFIGKREEPKETKALIGKANMLLGWKPTTKIEDWFKEY